MNPEFKRNLWLEISPSRLMIMPMVLGLISVLSILDNKTPLVALLISVAILCAALIVVWGSYAVVASINSEVTERTWNQQRMSALSPWEMAWGKLFGSAAYAWYGGLLCALVIFVVSLSQPNTFTLCVWLLTGFVATVGLHAWSMASRLHTLDLQAVKNTGVLGGGLFGLLLFIQIPAIFFRLTSRVIDEDSVLSSWWGLDLPLPIQNLLLASLFLVLGLLALWRSMSKQLMLRTTPWAWALGVLTLGLIFAGYIITREMRTLPLLVIAETAIIATYFVIMTEKNNLLVWRAVVFHWKNSNIRRFFQALPLWPVSLLMALIFAGVYTLLPAGERTDAGASVATSILWMAALHCLRDCGIYLFFAWRNTSQKPLGMTMLTLFILGAILPMMFIQLDLIGIAQFFEPMFSFKNQFEITFALGLTEWASMFGHLLIVGALLLWRWSKSPKTE